MSFSRRILSAIMANQRCLESTEVGLMIAVVCGGLGLMTLWSVGVWGVCLYRIACATPHFIMYACVGGIIWGIV